MISHVYIFNPYPRQGGGGEIQSSLMDLVSSALPKAKATLVPFPRRTHGVVLKMLLRPSHVSLFQVPDQSLFIIQSCFEPSSLWLAKFAKERRIPYLLLPRGDFPPSLSLFSFVRQPILKWIIWLTWSLSAAKGAKAVVASSTAERERISAAGINPRKIIVIGNTIPTPAVPETIQAPQVAHVHLSDTSNKHPYALWLGRLAREKGIDIIFQAWPLIIKKNPNARLVIAGNIDHPELHRSLVELCHTLQIHNNVEFLGYTSGLAKAKLIAQARCLLLPSHFESFGNVVVEALASHTPVIASTGTPWEILRQYPDAGRWLSRDKRLWSDAILHYLSSNDKMAVPDPTSRAILSQFTRPFILQKWSSLVKRVSS
jgi:glycosyltransferase involved in cell wall biosynthesis